MPLNAFELDVMNRLTEKGIPVTPQYGVAGYWLDFACGHPDPAGGMVLAIEADGASYHSAYTGPGTGPSPAGNLGDQGMAVPPHLVDGLVQES